MSQANVLTGTPTFNAHRVNVGAADVDTLPSSTARIYGVSADDYRYVCFAVRVSGGDDAANCTVRPVFWDDISAQWVVDGGIAASTFDQTTGTLPGQSTFEASGRPFYIAITAVNGADSPLISIDVAGYGLLV